MVTPKEGVEFQSQEVGVFVLASVKVTELPSHIVKGLPENAAIGAVELLLSVVNCSLAP